jgi:exosortase A
MSSWLPGIEGTADPSARRGSAAAHAGPWSRWAASAAGVALGTAALIGLFWDTAVSAVLTWHGSDLYGHGFLIVPIAGFLCWRRRLALAGATPEPCFWGLVPMAAAGFAWMVGAATGTVLVQQLALVAMVQALCLTVLGTRVVEILVLPLLYLFFAVPFGNFLIAPLQDLTARATVLVVQLAGVPLRVEGILLQIPSASFQVAEACAGVRFLLASLALGVLAADLFYGSWRRRLAFIGLAVAVPIVANVLRASAIILIAHWNGRQAAVDFDHVTYGLVFLGFVLLCLFALGLTFRDSAPPGHPNSDVAAPSGRARAPLSFGLAAVLSLAVAGGAFWAGAGQSVETEGEARAALSTPAAEPPWRSVGETGSWWRPSFPGAHGELRQTFARGDRSVDLYVAYYAYQRQGAEVVSATNRLADDKRWIGSEAGGRRVAVDGAPFTVAYRRFVAGAARRTVWYWYWVDGRFTANPYMAKVLQAKARLWGGIGAAAVVAIAADEGAEAGPIEDLLGDFLKHAGPLQDMLRRAAGTEALP